MYWEEFHGWAVRNGSAYSWWGSARAKALWPVPQDKTASSETPQRVGWLEKNWRVCPMATHKLKEWKLAFSVLIRGPECPGGALPARFPSQLPSTISKWGWPFWKRDMQWDRSSYSSSSENIADVAQGAADKGLWRADCKLLVITLFKSVFINRGGFCQFCGQSILQVESELAPEDCSNNICTICKLKHYHCFEIFDMKKFHCIQTPLASHMRSHHYIC